MYYNFKVQIEDEFCNVSPYVSHLKVIFKLRWIEIFACAKLHLSPSFLLS